MLQAALPCLLFAPRPTKLILKGGTDVDMAPPIDYFSRVFLPVAQKFGVECSHNLVKRLVLSNSHHKTIKTVSF